MPVESFQPVDCCRSPTHRPDCSFVWNDILSEIFSYWPYCKTSSHPRVRDRLRSASGRAVFAEFLSSSVIKMLGVVIRMGLLPVCCYHSRSEWMGTVRRSFYVHFLWASSTSAAREQRLVTKLFVWDFPYSDLNKKDYALWLKVNTSLGVLKDVFSCFFGGGECCAVGLEVLFFQDRFTFSMCELAWCLIHILGIQVDRSGVGGWREQVKRMLLMVDSS